MKNRRFEESNQLPWFGVRHLQCLLLFFGLTMAYAMRVNLSMAIVAMTDRKHANPDFEEYEWDERTRSIVLSSFFWGYIVTPIAAGRLALKYGGKVMLLWGILLSSMLAILTPVSAHIGDWKLTCAMRMAQGLSQGLLFPSTHTILAKWAPVEERGTLATYAYTGTQLGTVLMLAFSGVLASSSIGWPGIFYFPGGLGLLWCVVYYKWGSSSPSEYKGITVEERELIERSLGQTVKSNDDKKNVPWLKFFTSVPFYALVATQCAHNWGYWTLLTQIPTYMKNILGVNIKSNALLSSLPYFAMLVLSFVCSGASSVIINRKYVTLSTNRKLFNTISQWIAAVGLIGMGYVQAGQVSIAVALLTLTVGINAAAHLGFHVNQIDLSPNYAGLLLGISNCISNFMSILAPLVVGFVVTNEKNADQWRLVFFLAAGVYFIGNLLFIVFGSTDVQPWNYSESLRQSEEKQYKKVNGEEQTSV